jgi:hypothetical protein
MSILLLKAQLRLLDTLRLNYLWFRALVLRSAKRVGGWLQWRCYVEVRCAWCQPKKVLRKAWIRAEKHSDGFCPACAKAWTADNAETDQPGINNPPPVLRSFSEGPVLRSFSEGVSPARITTRG